MMVVVAAVVPLFDDEGKIEFFHPLYFIFYTKQKSTIFSIFKSALKIADNRPLIQSNFFGITILF